MNRLVCASALLLVVPLLMGATCTLTEATANPNNIPNRLDEKGTYNLGQNEFFLVIFGCAKLTGTNQTTTVDARTDQQNKTWSATLQLAAGEYECYGALFYHVGNPMNPTIDYSNKLVRMVQ